jgi:hypothetical protein
VDSGPSLRSTVTPITFAQNGRRHHTTSISDTLKLDTIPGMASIDVEKGAVVEDSGDSSNPRFVLPSQHFDLAVQRL